MATTQAQDIRVVGSDESAIADLLMREPELRGVPRTEIARLLNSAERISIRAGERLYEAGTKAERLYLIESGALELRTSEGGLCKRRRGMLGLEGVVGRGAYCEGVTAAVDAALVVLSSMELGRLAEKDPRLLKRLFAVYEGRHQDLLELDQSATFAGKPKPEGDSINRQLTGWLLAFVLPLLLYALQDKLGLSENVLLLGGIIVEAVVMWIFDLVPSFVPPLFSILMIILLDVAPPKVALSGFSSGTFVMCLSVFGISALIIKSGLAYRMSLWLLRLVPAGRMWYGLCLFLVGFLLTPVVPNKSGRLSIVLPFLVELLNLADRKPRNDTATQFVMSAVLGATLMTPVFLTGSSLNLIMFGLFDEQTRFTFGWVYWLFAASIPALLLWLSYLALMAVAFRRGAQVVVSRQRLAEQSRVLGGISRLELGTLITLLCIIVLIPTVKFHKIEIPWLMLTVSVILLLLGALGQKEYQGRIDWPILLFIGSILAWPQVMKTTGMDDLITTLLVPVTAYMKHQFVLFTVLLSLAMTGLRFFLPFNAAAILFAAVLLPVANASGVSPWVIGFIILMTCENSVFPYQDLQRMQIDSALALHGLGTMQNAAKSNFIYFSMAAVRLGVILVSIPLWHHLDLL